MVVVIRCNVFGASCTSVVAKKEFTNKLKRFAIDAPTSATDATDAPRACAIGVILENARLTLDTKRIIARADVANVRRAAAALVSRIAL